MRGPHAFMISGSFSVTMPMALSPGVRGDDTTSHFSFFSFIATPRRPGRLLHPCRLVLCRHRCKGLRELYPNYAEESKLWGRMTSLRFARSKIRSETHSGSISICTISGSPTTTEALQPFRLRHHSAAARPAVAPVANDACNK